MSSKIVRQKARQWIVPAAAGIAPFYESVNTQVSAQDPLWVTLEFDSFGREYESFCGDTTETGTINIVVFGRAGVGDDAVITAAEKIASNFYDYGDPSNGLILVDLAAPEELFSNDGSPQYAVSVTIEYEYRLRVTGSRLVI
jgi:hypothetical protein